MLVTLKTEINHTMKLFKYILGRATKKEKTNAYK